MLATAARVEASGGEFFYEQADAGVREQFDAAVTRLTARAGRMRGVIVAAGVLHDSPIGSKTFEQFASVVAPKVRSAANARAALADHPLRFALLFGSLAALTGNQAQVDYSAANAALAGLAHDWNAGVDYPVRALIWSVWTEAGSVPALIRKELAARGMAGIGNTEGARLALAEINTATSHSCVVLSPRSVIDYLARGLCTAVPSATVSSHAVNA